MYVRVIPSLSLRRKYKININLRRLPRFVCLCVFDHLIYIVAVFGNNNTIKQKNLMNREEYQNIQIINI